MICDLYGIIVLFSIKKETENMLSYSDSNKMKFSLQLYGTGQ